MRIYTPTFPSSSPSTSPAVAAASPRERATNVGDVVSGTPSSPWQSAAPTAALRRFGRGGRLDRRFQPSRKIWQWLFLPRWSCLGFGERCCRALEATLGLPACAVPGGYPAHLLTYLCPGRRFLTVRKMKGLTLSWSYGLGHLSFLPYVWETGDVQNFQVPNNVPLSSLETCQGNGKPMTKCTCGSGWSSSTAVLIKVDQYWSKKASHLQASCIE